MTSRTHKISVVGAGNVGAASAATIAARGLGTVFLHDHVEGLATGKAMDINHASALFDSASRLVATQSLDELAGSDMVIFAAGSPRKAGMRRADLLRENLAVLRSVCQKVLPASPAASVFIVTNPVDTLTGCLQRMWPERSIFGLGCLLDTVRFRYFLAAAAGQDVRLVRGIVIGTHSDSMVPLVRHARINEATADKVLSADQIDSVVARTRGAGAAIVEQLRTRGSYYAASCCVAEVVRAVVEDTGAEFPLSVPCDGQYGYHDTCLALPARLGRAGVVSVLPMDLDAQERAALDACAVEVQASMFQASARV